MLKSIQKGILLTVLTAIILLSGRAFAGAIMISGAMDVETELMIAALDNRQEYKIGAWRYVSGEYKNCPLIISVTEIGCGNAAASTALGIEKFKPSAVINQGTAGAHHRNIHRRDIIIGVASFDISAHILDYDGKKLFGSYVYDETGGVFNQKIVFPADPQLLDAAREAGRTYTSGKIYEGKIALNKQFNSLCEEMETAAVAQICYDYDVPFLGVRIISNNELTGEPFDRNIGELCQSFALEIARQYYETALR